MNIGDLVKVGCILAQFFVYEREYRGRDAHNNKCGDRAPNGVGFGEFPNSEDAQDRAGDKRHCDNDEGNDPYQFRLQDAAKVGVGSFKIFVFHLPSKSVPLEKFNGSIWNYIAVGNRTLL